MIAPRLVQLTDGSLAGPLEAQRFRFRVERGGMIGETRVESGEVLVCGGEPRDGQVTVLVARGPGRPRIGKVQGIRLLGEVGEGTALTNFGLQAAGHGLKYSCCNEYPQLYYTYSGMGI